MRNGCYYVCLWSGKEHHDDILLELVRPIVKEFDAHPALDSFFFVRYNLPRWQLRFRILGDAEWITDEARPRVERALPELLARGLVEGTEIGEYDREFERYGGPEGMEFAEELFRHDAMAALDLVAADAAGSLEKSRREFGLLMTEALLDCLEFDAKTRVAFYRMGYQWALDQNIWTNDDIPALDRKYDQVREGIAALVEGGDVDRVFSPSERFGGEEPARIATECIAKIRPVARRLLEAHVAGRISQDLVSLAWSYAHMHANRLGIDVFPEAISRYLMFRHYTSQLDTSRLDTADRSGG